MSDTPAPAIALLASRPAKRDVLAQVLSGFGYRVVFSDAAEQLAPSDLAAIEADAWLLDVADECELADWLLEHSPVPVLLGVGEIPPVGDDEHVRWQRRLYAKLLPLLGCPPSGEAPEMPAPALAPARVSCVWVLAASLGGPSAVKAFLDALPAGLPIAFVYAQHIDAGFEAQLPGIVGRHNAWRLINCSAGTRLEPGDVMVAPIGRAMRFGPDGEVRMLDIPWPGPYQPAIESVIDEATRAFAPACGAIIFSGMGEDGVAACGRLRQQGMEVWTQTAESAVCAIMPQAVQDAGHSSRQGTPEQLADALTHWLEQEWAVAH